MTYRSRWVSDAAPFDSLPDRVQQHVVIEWLRQEFDSARLHSLHRHEYIPMARNEDDRHVGPLARDALLQVETIEAGKRYVKNEAAGNKGSWMRKEFLRRRECLRLPAFAADQQFQRFAHGDVVVNDENNRCGGCRGKHR